VDPVPNPLRVEQHNYKNTEQQKDIKTKNEGKRIKVFDGGR
jgi:hypothetical protein